MSKVWGKEPEGFACACIQELEAYQDEVSWLANNTAGKAPVHLYADNNVPGGHSDSGGTAPTPHSLQIASSSSSCCSNNTGSSSRRHRFTCCCQRVLISLLPPVSRPPDTTRLVYLGCTSWFACRTDRITSDRWISGAQQTQKHNHPLGTLVDGG